MELTELKKLLKLLRSNGVLKYECQGIKLELSESSTEQTAAAPAQGVLGEEELTAEQLLFYSAPEIPIMEAPEN